MRKKKGTERLSELFNVTQPGEWRKLTPVPVLWLGSLPGGGAPRDVSQGLAL